MAGLALIVHVVFIEAIRAGGQALEATEFEVEPRVAGDALLCACFLASLAVGMASFAFEVYGLVESIVASGLTSAALEGVPRVSNLVALGAVVACSTVALAAGSIAGLAGQ